MFCDMPLQMAVSQHVHINRLLQWGNGSLIECMHFYMQLYINDIPGFRVGGFIAGQN
jgi:hypothetical protein